MILVSAPFPLGLIWVLNFYWDLEFGADNSFSIFLRFFLVFLLVQCASLDAASNRWQTSESEPELTHILTASISFSLILSIADYISIFVFGKPNKTTFGQPANWV